MVQDIRKIGFTNNELLTAFECYGRTTPKFLPGGKILSCNPVDDDGVNIRIAMEYGSTVHEVEFIYRGNDVLKPLILFCIENNIMLPRDGRKSFAIVEGRAIVTIELDLDLDLTAAMAPLTNEHIRLIKSDKKNHPNS